MENAELKVYELLTQEIQTAEAQTYQLVSIGAGAVAAILAAGFNQQDDVLRLFMFLTPYLIILPVIRLLSGNRSRIWRIATYMQVYLEPDLPSVKWQTHLAALAAKRGPTTFIIPSQMLVLRFATLAVGLAIMGNVCKIERWDGASFIPHSGSFNWVAPAVAAVVLLINIQIVRYQSKIERDLRRNGPKHRAWLHGWEELRLQGR